jgi:hypothetical protein
MTSFAESFAFPLLVAVNTTILCNGCANPPHGNSNARNPATVSAAAVSESELESRKKDLQFESLMKDLDLNDSQYVLKYKNTGTSLGIKIEVEKESFGKWVPENSATDVEAQVVSYYLGRFLNMSSLDVPSHYYLAKGRMLAEFKQMVTNASEKNKWRRENRDEILETLEDHPDDLLGVFTDHVRNAEALDIANPDANTINRNHPIAQFIQVTGPMPSKEKTMTLKGIKDKNKNTPSNTELQLAREFSQIMVMDILTGEWDRWSGGNVEGTWNDSGVHFLARDNGGATMAGASGLKKYFGIVTRFDRGQIERVRHLHHLLNQDPEGTAALLRMRSRPKSLINRVNALLAHVNEQIEDHSEDKVFFPD